MAAPASPVNAALQFKREATWGTDIAATKRMGVRLLEPDIAVGAILSGNMSGSRVRTGIAKGGHKARFTFETDMEYVNGATDPNGYCTLHDLIMGSTTFGTYAAAVSGSGPYIHEFTNKSVMNSATMELIDGYPGAASTKCLQITGCKVEEAELSFGWSFDGEEHIPKWRVTMVGKTASPDTAFTDRSATPMQTPDIISSKHCVVADGVLSPATSAYFSVKIKIKNNLYTEGFSSLSDYITEPVALNFLEATIELEADYDSYTLLSNMISQTASAANIQFAFTRPGAGGTAYIIKALAGYSKITSHKYSVRPGSPVRQTFVWTPTKDSVNSAIIAQILSAANLPGSEG